MKTMRVLVVAVLVGVMSVVSRPVLSQDNPASVSSERYDDDGDDESGCVHVHHSRRH